MLNHAKMQKLTFGTSLNILIAGGLLISQLALGAPLGLHEYHSGEWVNPDKSYSGKKIALNLSGYHDTIDKCHGLASFFGPNFDTILGFEYSSYVGIDKSAQLLTQEIKELAQNRGQNILLCPWGTLNLNII
ncbi:MAG: hypothetical protein ABIQ95_10425 [Bdellovibrionia bacterium]